MAGSQHGQHHHHQQQQLLLEETSMIDDNLNYKMMLMMSKMNEGAVGTLSPGGRAQSNSTPPPQAAQFCAGSSGQPNPCASCPSFESHYWRLVFNFYFSSKYGLD